MAKCKRVKNITYVNRKIDTSAISATFAKLMIEREGKHEKESKCG